METIGEALATSKPVSELPTRWENYLNGNERECPPNATPTDFPLTEKTH
ncbi:MAG: hypothetical protein F6J86_41420 [Symploca sp. SIO1B1]|nr:hypothetical protein [Symploca sp. SIO1B1]